MNKKVKKLFRDPKIFFKDMYLKRSTQLKKHIPIKRNGNHTFTVVSAVYNVEKYLDHYFNSLTTQSLDFKKHIHIILVDDGSTDTSAQIIQKWQKKYPKNIRYIYKENGGQASARNLGLEHVETEWVVFTDPDDYLHPDYFKSVDFQLSQNHSANMLVTNINFFIESQNLTKDRHPLRFRFEQTRHIKASKLDKFINLSAASTFFKYAHIQKNHLLFDDKVKPNFEDGKFIADYLIDQQNSDVIFDKDAIYFYRKRENATSTLDTSWQKPEKFADVFEFGFIPMLQNYKKQFGAVPASIQKTALYDMSWYIQYLLNKPERIDFLSEDQREKFYQLMNSVFSYIDEKNIMEFGLAGTWLFHKVGMLGAFKNTEPPFQIAYIENIDRERKQFLISYFTHFDLPYSVQADGWEMIPAYEKTVINTLNEKLFAYEKRLWIPYGGIESSTKLNILLNQKPMRISIKGKTFTKGITVEELTGLFRPSEKYRSDGSWLLMDRETKADDNAEHFYRYMMKHHPEQTCYFVLNKTAPDWQRLEQEGFNLVEFGSKEYEKRLRQAEKIISSHLEKHINNYFDDLYDYSKKFIFLQHGVTKDNLSAWTNSKKNLHCFITTTEPEYQSIRSNFNTYKLTKKEVALTGFTRYDNLLSKNQPGSKKILIMPTWRSNIVGQNIGVGSNTRTLNNAFMETEYAQSWHGLLHSPTLKTLTEKYGYEVIFAPHPNIEPYLDVLNIPNYIQIWSGLRETESIQNLFGRCAVLITDYSSVAFDMAYLNKAVIYYQFDKETFFSGIHTYQKGYFSYENDGFGPVTSTQEETLSELETILRSSQAKPEYLSRIQATFPFQQGGNCERVYQAIISLDKPETADNLPIVRNMIIQAENHQAWELAAARILSLLDDKKLDAKERQEYEQRYLVALFKGNQLAVLADYLDNYEVNNALYWRAKTELKIGHTAMGAKFFAEYNTGTLEDKLVALLVASYCNDMQSAEALNQHIIPELPEDYRPFLLLAEKIGNQEYFAALGLIETLLEKLSVSDKNVFKLELLASYLCIRQNNLQQAHNYLVRYEEHCSGDPVCRIAIARLAKLRHDGKKLFTQINRAFDTNLLMMPRDLVPAYLQELHRQGNTETEEMLLAQFLEKYPQSKTIALYQAEKLYQNHEWQALADLLNNHIRTSERAMYLHAFALCRLKQSSQAQDIFNAIPEQDSFEYWKLAAEIAESNGDKDLLKHSLEKQLEKL